MKFLFKAFSLTKTFPNDLIQYYSLGTGKDSNAPSIIFSFLHFAVNSFGLVLAEDGSEDGEVIETEKHFI